MIQTQTTMVFLTVMMVSLLIHLKQQISIGMEYLMIKMKMMMETMFLTPLKLPRDLTLVILILMVMDLTMEQRPYVKPTLLIPTLTEMDLLIVRTISH